MEHGDKEHYSTNNCRNNNQKGFIYIFIVHDITRRAKKPKNKGKKTALDYDRHNRQITDGAKSLCNTNA